MLIFDFSTACALAGACGWLVEGSTVGADDGTLTRTKENPVDNRSPPTIANADQAATALPSRAAGFADSRRLMPIGGDVPSEIAAIDGALLLVAKHAAAVDVAAQEGMWRTWMMEALVDAENEARAAVVRALASLIDHADWRGLVEQRRAGLDAFLRRYPGRLP